MDLNDAQKQKIKVETKGEKLKKEDKRENVVDERKNWEIEKTMSESNNIFYSFKKKLHWRKGGPISIATKQCEKSQQLLKSRRKETVEIFFFPRESCFHL